MSTKPSHLRLVTDEASSLVERALRDDARRIERLDLEIARCEREARHSTGRLAAEWAKKAQRLRRELVRLTTSSIGAA